MPPTSPQSTDIIIIRRAGTDAHERGGIAFWEIFRAAIAELSGITKYEDARIRGDKLARGYGVAVWYVHDPQRPGHRPQLLADYNSPGPASRGEDPATGDQ